MVRRTKREFPGVTAYFDRHKKRRFRFRMKGFSSEIHGEYGSDAFRQNYERALRGYRSQEIGAPATKRGTINALVVSYYKSPEFVSLSASTKATYRREIERLRNEHGHRLVGASEREIMAWTGHTSPQMVQIYAGKARRGLMADQGFAKLRQNETGSKTDEPKTKGSTK